MLTAAPSDADILLYQKDADGDGEIDRHLSLVGYMQTRFIHRNKDTYTEDRVYDNLDLQKARFGMQGRLHKYLAFKAEFDFSRYSSTTGGEGTTIYEVYAFLPLLRYFELKGGMYKAPVRVHYLTSGAYRLFSVAPVVVDFGVLDRAGVPIGQEIPNPWPEIDAGGMVQGDLFPIVQIPLFEDLPSGMLRYAFSVQSGDKVREADNQDLMYTLRVEANPLGFVGYYESDWVQDRPLCNVGFNYGWQKNVNKVEIERKYRLIGVDGYVGYKGFLISGGWYRYDDDRTAEAGSPQELERQWSVDPEESWKAEGFYVQGSAFLPIPHPWFKDRLELKYRYEQFDPRTNTDRNPFSTGGLPSDVPNRIDNGLRGATIHSFGANAYFFDEALRLAVEYRLIHEKRDFYVEEADRFFDTQIKNNELIVQMQLKL